MAFGDHLLIRYPAFTHHAIDLGDGYVIEYGGKGEGRMSVRRRPLSEFLGRGECFLVEHPPGAALSRQQTVALAFSRLGEDAYDLLHNNCEHLANWCKTGRHASGQADALRGLLVIVAVGLLIAWIASLEQDCDSSSRGRAA